jgi:hypothetical protein
MPCYPSLAAHHFSEYTTVNGISLSSYVVRAMSQKKNLGINDEVATF